MQRFVFWTGVYNVVLAVILLIPGMPGRFGLPAPEPIGWLYLTVFFVFVFGAIVIVASKDLKNRAIFVVWDGIGRVSALAAAVLGSMGLGAIAFGAVDTLIALVYFIKLPGYVGTSLWNLITGKVLPPATEESSHAGA